VASIFCGARVKEEKRSRPADAFLN